MHPFAERFFALLPEQKRTAHLWLAEVALERWDRFLATGPALGYVESVAGTCQLVERRLPRDALLSARAGRDLNGVAGRYLEPICALQDGDLRLPDDEGYAYYAIYNAFQRYALGREVDDWLIVNQALSSLGPGSSETLSYLGKAVDVALAGVGP
jgi:hypothetical protein